MGDFHSGSEPNQLCDDGTTAAIPANGAGHIQGCFHLNESCLWDRLPAHQYSECLPEVNLKLPDAFNRQLPAISAQRTTVNGQQSTN